MVSGTREHLILIQSLNEKGETLLKCSKGLRKWYRRRKYKVLWEACETVENLGNFLCTVSTLESICRCSGQLTFTERLLRDVFATVPDLGDKRSREMRKALYDAFDEIAASRLILYELIHSMQDALERCEAELSEGSNPYLSSTSII